MVKILFIKSITPVSVKAHTRKDGVFVKEHIEMREKKPAGYQAGDRVVTVHGDKYTVKGPDPKNPERLIAKEDGAAFDSSILIANIKGKAGVPKKKAKAAGGKVTLYHGSYEPKIDKVHDGGVFGGLFAGEKGAAMSHGDYLHSIDVDEDKILDHAESANLTGKKLATANRVIKENLHGKYSKAEYGAIRDAVLDDTNVDSLSDARVAQITGWIDDETSVSWQIQMIRGKVAAALGYHAVKMKDEHGTTTLVLPGVTVKPAK